MNISWDQINEKRYTWHDILQRPGIYDCITRTGSRNQQLILIVPELLHRTIKDEDVILINGNVVFGLAEPNFFRNEYFVEFYGTLTIEN